MLNVIRETPTHKIESAGQIYKPTKEDIERNWRDSELLRTDSMLRPDRPNYQAILDYRAALRDYPSNIDFPNGARPSL